MSHAPANDEFGCQVCGECTRTPSRWVTTDSNTVMAPHPGLCNCPHVPRDEKPRPPDLAVELQTTNNLLRELIAELRGAHD